jgi:ABC-type Fe3+-siderophore transport system permease subunit
VGTILSQTGSFLQTSTRNILAGPSTLGFDGMSILWILISHSVLLYFQIEPTFQLILFSGLFPFFLLGAWFAFFLSKFKKVEKLIFMGLIFGLLVGAVFSLWHFLFLAFNLPFPVELWFGHFRFADLQSATFLILLELFLLAGWMIYRKEIKLFSLGPDVGANFNLKVKNLYHFIFISISLATFVIITLFGSFSFLGLIFPLISRKMWFKKFDLDGEVVVGGIVNGLVLMAVDLLCYFFPIMGAEIPVGLIATAVGALSLILILIHSDNRLEILANRQK